MTAPTYTHRTQAKAKRSQRTHHVMTYGLLDTLFASPDAPMPAEKRQQKSYEAEIKVEIDSALEIAVHDLEQAKRDYLVAMQHSEYYAAQASYNDGLISRLSNYIKESTDGC